MKGIYFIRHETSWPFMKLIKVSYSSFRWMTFANEFALFKNEVSYTEIHVNYNTDINALMDQNAIPSSEIITTKCRKMLFDWEIYI